MSRARSNSKWRPVVKGAAAAALAAAFATPLLRKKLNIPAGATVAAMAAGPPALAVLKPRTRTRDAGLFALQMWGFLNGKDMPTDDLDALRERLRVDYPIRADMAIGRGSSRTCASSAPSRGCCRRATRSRAPSPGSTGCGSSSRTPRLVWILARHPERFPRSARQMAAVFDIGCAVYAAVPTAPPWWASEQGRTEGQEVRRIMVEVGEKRWGRAWEPMYGYLGGNPWAAMPSLHFAASLMAAILLTEAGPVEGAVGWAYCGTLGFALVYLGEHYVIDLIAGAALVLAVRKGEQFVEPAANLVSRGLQRLERIANQ